MGFASQINGSTGIMPRSISGDRLADSSVGSEQIADGSIGLVDMVHSTWQTPTMHSGWAVGPASGSVQPLQFRLGPLDQLEIVGACHSTTASPGATVCTIVSPTPHQTQRVPAIVNSSGTVTAAFVEIQPGGSVLIIPAPTTSGVDVYLCSAPTLGNSA